MKAKATLKNAGVMTVITFFITMWIMLMMSSGGMEKKIAEICMPFIFLTANAVLFALIRCSKKSVIITASINFAMLAGYAALLRLLK